MTKYIQHNAVERVAYKQIVIKGNYLNNDGVPIRDEY